MHGNPTLAPLPPKSFNLPNGRSTWTLFLDQLVDRNLARSPCPVSDLYTVRLDLVVKRLAADAEAFGGLQLIAAGFTKHLDDGIALNSLKQREIGVRGAVGLCGHVRDRQVGGIDFAAFAQQ